MAAASPACVQGRAPDRERPHRLLPATRCHAITMPPDATGAREPGNRASPLVVTTHSVPIRAGDRHKA